MTSDQKQMIKEALTVYVKESTHPLADPQQFTKVELAKKTLKGLN